MKKIPLLFLMTLIVCCQSEDISVAKLAIDKEQLLSEIVKHENFEKMRDNLQLSKENAFENLSNLNQGDSDYLNNILKAFSGSQILNASTLEIDFIKGIMPVDKNFIQMRLEIVSDLKRKYIFSEIDFYEVLLNELNSGVSARAIECSEVEHAVYMTVFSDCMVYGGDLGDCLQGADVAANYAYIGCVAKELGRMPW